ncbi:indole-3-glycerol-phosphate synthase [Desulfovibrio sp. OttesenSCG-928-A18]|nr:indole-3-glycerol-phosphate synthase [Desulfovibrio sp. OttesenSCG-928-A18]
MMNFLQTLKQCALTRRMPVIADIKRHSPKEGPLLGDRDALKLAETLVLAGAPALSVVTEEKYFGGSLAMLERISAKVSVPVLRKDFIRSEEQIRESASAGAAAVLLIVALLDEKRLGCLYEAALKHGLTALVETHKLSEIEMANAISPELVGINNRDIMSLEKDDGGLGTTEALVRAIRGKEMRGKEMRGKVGRDNPVQGGPFIVSESSIMSPGDVARAKKAGADAVLVGTALLKASDIAQKYKELSMPSTEGI